MRKVSLCLRIDVNAETISNTVANKWLPRKKWKPNWAFHIFSQTPENYFGRVVANQLKCSARKKNGETNLKTS